MKKIILLIAVAVVTFNCFAQTIAGGDNHSIAVCNDNTAISWGNNLGGQLGDGTGTNRWTPVQVLSLTNVTAVAGGGYHSLALKNDSTVWAWGYNSDGQLGDGTTTDRWTPVQVLSLTGITAIACGRNRSIALKNDGTVWDWGSSISVTPIQVLSLTGITTIARGSWHFLALKNDNTVWTWTTTDTPVQVLSLTGITAIAGGGYSSLALKNDGTLWAWGNNWYGQLGDGTNDNRNTPVQMNNLCPVIIPIELLSFNAYAENNSTVKTEWSTASEINNDYFSIERSLDAVIFEQIGRVEGAPNSNTIRNYVFYDEHPYTGISYYRLKQTDYDGKYSYSEIKAVYIGMIDIISIFPNPAHDYIQYKIVSEDGGEVTVKVIDVLGREVINKTETIKSGITTKELSTTNLASGSYMLRIITKKEDRIQKQFVIK